MRMVGETGSKTEAEIFNLTVSKMVISTSMSTGRAYFCPSREITPPTIDLDHSSAHMPAFEVLN
jgi:hypothetical protein